MTDHRSVSPIQDKRRGLLRPGLWGPGLRGVALALALALAPAGAAQAWAEDPHHGDEDPSELARDGIERLMRALDGFVRMIPQYDLPELTEDGDIIIRRRRPGEQPEPPKRESPEVDNTET